MAKEAPQKLKERLLALMARKNHNDGTNEAAIAATLFHKLVAEYEIAISTLEAEEGSVVDVDATREKLTCRMGVLSDWQNSLLEAITNNSFCLGWREGDMSKLYNLVGRRINLMAVIHTYDYLSKTIVRMCPYLPKEKAYADFAQGCTQTVIARLADQRRASEESSEQARGNGTDLVLADVYGSEADRNSDFRMGWEPGTTKRRRLEWFAECEARRKEREAAALNAPPKPPETEAQKREREAESARWYADYQRRQRKEAAKRDQKAYSLGSEAGRSISLNRQITEAERAALAIAGG